jgi:hypothetical protein
MSVSPAPTPQSAQAIVNSLQSQVTMWVIVACVAIVATIILVIFMVVKNLLRTKEGKIIDSAKGKRSHLILAASLGPFAMLLKANDFNPEGVLETVKFKNRWKKKNAIRRIYNPPKKQIASLDVVKEQMGLPPMPTQVQLEAAQLTRDLIQKELDLTTEKVFLEGCRIPVSVAVEDKVVWSGIKGLGAETFFNKLEAIQRVGPKIQILLNSPIFKEVGEVLEQMYNKVSLVPFDLVRSYFGESYDQSNDKSQKEYHYTMGFNDGVESVKKGSDSRDKMFMYLGIMGIGGGCAIAAIGLFLGK